MSAPQFLHPLDPASQLDALRRDRDIHAAIRGVDVVVVGGGVTGAGVALDAVTRGLSVALLEQGDVANGTSRWSSKLVHGGLRYLAKGDVAVAWESAVERAAVAGRIAPHLIRPLPQVMPDYDPDRNIARLSRLGYLAGDMMRVAARTQHGLLDRGRHIQAGRAMALVPAMREPDLHGAVVGYDCQLEDDARLVLGIVRTAAAYGARILTRTRVTSIDGHKVCARDEITGEAYEIPAEWTINATGVWASDLDPAISLRPSLGTHVVIPSELLGDSRASLTVAVPEHFGRFVFTLPQPDGLTYVGLTDSEVRVDSLAEPTPPVDDIAWILDVLSTALAEPITPDQAIGAFAGVRPLVECAEDTSADISRRHLVRSDGPLVTVTGGKLTTYRRMAEDAVDAISDAPCRTRDIALIGAGPRPERADVPERLWRRYGNEAPAVWDMGSVNPALREPLPGGMGVLGVEIAFAMEAELGLCAADLVHRRTRLGVLYDHKLFEDAVLDRFGEHLVHRDLDASQHPQPA